MMRVRPVAVAVLAALLILAVGTFVKRTGSGSTGSLWAQEEGEGRSQRRGQGGGPGMGGGGMMGGGAMVTMGDRIYVLQGPTLFKIDPAKMKVEAQLSLKPEGAGESGKRGGHEDQGKPPPPDEGGGD